MKGLTDELFRMAVVLVLVVVALTWAIGVLRPVLPVLAVLALGGVVMYHLIRRRGLR